MVCCCQVLVEQSRKHRAFAYQASRQLDGLRRLFTWTSTGHIGPGLILLRRNFTDRHIGNPTMRKAYQIHFVGGDCSTNPVLLSPEVGIWAHLVGVPIGVSADLWTLTKLTVLSTCITGPAKVESAMHRATNDRRCRSLVTKQGDGRRSPGVLECLSHCANFGRDHVLP